MLHPRNFGDSLCRFFRCRRRSDDFRWPTPACPWLADINSNTFPYPTRVWTSSRPKKPDRHGDGLDLLAPNGQKEFPCKEISVQVWMANRRRSNSAVSKVALLYAPLKQRDLRIGNYLYLRLATPIGKPIRHCSQFDKKSKERIEQKKKKKKENTFHTNNHIKSEPPLPSTFLDPHHYPPLPWPPKLILLPTANPLRWSPAIHVNEVGYLPPRNPRKQGAFICGQPR